MRTIPLALAFCLACCATSGNTVWAQTQVSGHAPCTSDCRSGCANWWAGHCAQGPGHFHGSSCPVCDYKHKCGRCEEGCNSCSEVVGGCNRPQCEGRKHHYRGYAVKISSRTTDHYWRDSFVAEPVHSTAPRPASVVSEELDPAPVPPKNIQVNPRKDNPPVRKRASRAPSKPRLFPAPQMPRVRKLRTVLSVKTASHEEPIIKSAKPKIRVFSLRKSSRRRAAEDGDGDTVKIKYVPAKKREIARPLSALGKPSR